MTNKSTHWITDPEGAYAQVEGADQRDLWTRVRGWAEAGEPSPTDQVHVVNENPEIGPGRLPYAAVELHAGLGWSAGPPPEPAGAVEQAGPVDEPVKTSKPATGGTQSKEK